MPQWKIKEPMGQRYVEKFATYVTDLSQDDLEAHEAGAKLSFDDAMTMEYGISQAFIEDGTMA